MRGIEALRIGFGLRFYVLGICSLEAVWEFFKVGFRRFMVIVDLVCSDGAVGFGWVALREGGFGGCV